MIKSTPRIASILLLALIALAGDLAAQTPYWEETNLVGGERVIATAVTPDGTLYAGSWHGLFRSTDSGSSWRQLPVEPEWSPGAIGVAPNGMIVLGTAYGQLFRSTDDGATWRHSRFAPASSAWSVTTIAFDSKGTIYLGLEHEGMLRSTDDGETWVDMGFKFADGYIYSIIVDTDDAVIASASTGLHRTTDRGETWTTSRAVTLPHTLLRDIVRGPDGTLYIATYGGASVTSTGVYRSTDDGATWSAVNEGLTYLWAHEIAVTADGAIVVAADSSVYGSGGLFRSTDRGDSWRRIDEGFDHVLALDLLTTPDGAIVVSTQDSSTYPHHRYGGTLRRTDDGGATWRRISRGLTTPEVHSLGYGGGALFAGLQDGAVSVSTDRGASWSPTRISGYGQTLDLLPLDNGVVIAASHGMGILRSTDGGATFAPIPEIADTAGRTAGRDSLGRIYAIAQHLYRSTDDGATWTNIRENFGWVDEIVTSPTGRMFITGRGGIFRSYDNGDSWVWRPDGAFEQTRITTLAFLSDGTILAGSRGRRDLYLFRSTDDGESWTKLDGFTNDGIIQLLVDSRDRVYAASDSGMFRSLDRGLTWHSIHAGLGRRTPLSMTIDPTDGTIYVGTNVGVFRSTFSTNGPSSVRADIASHAVSATVDPATGILTLRVALDAPEHLRIALYDPLGQELAVLGDGEFAAGVHSLRHPLDAGVTLYRITSESRPATSGSIAMPGRRR